MDPMTKMWVSFVGIGLMAIAAVLVTFARYKLKGVFRFIVSAVAFVTLLIGGVIGFISVA
ncbi:sorbitol-specific phosphotransferase system component IIBC [Paenibacillus phyllosphaerae]|uniref:Sorbitol-specific phosphotransferase system component IIBC n=1 Tax=Paenibacillus phyllosphaerae TaxID=274593 RepID=A0A7W5FLI8_9BACL|nr:DUF2768 domain-containing protein [Paenibacillus phyllosphaerae]MBB3109270.1 sorbitol-specific phosphotransferase system component IIBC [Paenibacillus phyllosphaerae]